MKRRKLVALLMLVLVLFVVAAPSAPASGSCMRLYQGSTDLLDYLGCYGVAMIDYLGIFADNVVF